MNSSSIHTLCYLPPFVSLWKLIVTPVVAYLSDLTLLNDLKAQEVEVDQIFDHPLEMFLDPSLNDGEQLSEYGGENWPYKGELHVRHSLTPNIPPRGLIFPCIHHFKDTTDLKWLNESQYRMHRLRSSSTPIKGLTTDILVIRSPPLAILRDLSADLHITNIFTDSNSGDCFPEDDYIRTFSS